LQAREQQKPSTQNFNVHWLSALQRSPTGKVATQRPPAHHLPAPHCASVVQELAPAPQIAPEHVPGRHDCSWGGEQRPSPEQYAAKVATLLAQLPARQSVSLSGYAQPLMFLPLHMPLQLVPSLAQAVRAPCGAPVTGEQVPSLPGTSQASHCEPHDELQQ
jgi:hypothetical protein